MQPERNRFARHNDLTGPSRRVRSLRVFLALALATVAFAGLVPAAQAGTGGASSIATAPEEGLEGQDFTFSALRIAEASWYGGTSMWGRTTACGVTLRPTTLGVAHKKLPCGTVVKFVYHGQTLVTKVIDRGPYVKGRAWDLTEAASEDLGLEGVGNLRYAVAHEYARPALP
jgi:rare lipoprotein A